MKDDVMRDESKLDLIVIGAGNAGLGAAGIARAAGWKVAVIEARDIGGTCPLRGCVPKKVLVAAAEALDVIARADVHAIEVGAPRIDWPRLIAREREFVDGVPEQFEAGLTRKGIEVIHGHAHFVDRHTVEVDGRQLTARKFLVATGARPRPLGFAGADTMLTSDDILQMARLPESMAFVGAGVIGFEFAHVLVRAGVEVTMLELGERPLPQFDADLVDRLVAHTESLGVRVLTRAKTLRIERGQGGSVVHFERDGQADRLTVHSVANTSGRIPALDDLRLDRAGVELVSGRPLLADGFASQTNPDIHFAGDVLSGTPQLSPLATAEGRVVGRRLIGEDVPLPNVLAIPAAVYAVPALATVGHTEQSARAAGWSFEIRENDMSGWRSSKIQGEAVAYAKVLVADDGSILGAHLIGHQAAEIIHTFAFAIAHGHTAQDLKGTVFAYPTFSADIKHMV